jgi:uncharacterized protein YfaP (DUF2135 family)
MTHRRLTQGLVSGLAILLLVSASAFAKASRTIELSGPVLLGGTRIEPGQYQLHWEQHSPKITVTLAKGKTVVATAEGKIEQRNIKYHQNMVVHHAKAGGSEVILEIRLGGTNEAIVFSE